MLTSKTQNPKTISLERKDIVERSAQVAPNVKPKPKDVKNFLTFVVEGEQDKAEAMLKSNPALALVSGDATDLSEREFTGITGFQYAVWALDWHMWTMILKYLPFKDARLQAQEFENGAWVEDHDVDASGMLYNLLEAYEKVSERYKKDEEEWDGEFAESWVEEVGGAQLLLPAHVVNEYCHPTRSFKSCPNFRKDLPLPRSRKLFKGESDGENDWFTASYAGGKLGGTFALARWGAYAPVVISDNLGDAGLGEGEDDGFPDHDSIQALTEVRIAQRKELIAELTAKEVRKLNTKVETQAKKNPLMSTSLSPVDKDVKTIHDSSAGQQKPAQPQSSVTSKGVSNPIRSTNSLLQNLQMQLTEREQQNSASGLSSTLTDVQITLNTLVQDLQEIEKEKQTLKKTSQELGAQSDNLQKMLEKEIEDQESSKILLEQQKEEIKKQNVNLEKSLTQTFNAAQQATQAELKRSKKSYDLRLVQQQAEFQKQITDLKASLAKTSDSEQQKIQNELKESYDLRLVQQQAEFQKRHVDLEKKLTDTFSAEQQKMQTNLKAAEVRLSAVETQQAILWNEKTAKIEKRKAIEKFKSHPNLLLFYRTVHIKLEEIFISFKAVAGGFVNPVEGDFALVKSIFGVVGDTVSLVPLIGPAVEKFIKWTVNKGLEKADSARQNNIAINASRLVTLSEVGKYAGSIARQLTERYEYQLRQLIMTPDEEQANISMLKKGLDKAKEFIVKEQYVPSAQRLADFGVLWIIEQLRDAENIDKSKPLDEVLLLMISQKSPPARIKEFWNAITNKLGTEGGICTKSQETWHPEAVYTLPGIKTQENEYYRRTETLEVQLELKKYGWRLGTTADAKALGLEPVLASTAQSEIEQETKQHQEELSLASSAVPNQTQHSIPASTNTLIFSSASSGTVPRESLAVTNELNQEGRPNQRKPCCILS